jgi:hypothetical protein
LAASFLFSFSSIGCCSLDIVFADVSGAADTYCAADGSSAADTNAVD